MDAVPDTALRALNLPKNAEVEAIKALDRELRRIKRGLLLRIVLLRAGLLIDKLRDLALEVVCNLGEFCCQALLNAAHRLSPRKPVC